MLFRGAVSQDSDHCAIEPDSDRPRIGALEGHFLTVRNLCDQEKRVRSSFSQRDSLLMVIDNHVLLRSSLGMRRPAVNVQRAKVAHDLLLRLEPDVAKVLVAEDERSSAGSQEGEFVQSGAIQLRKLHPLDLGADMR